MRQRGDGAVECRIGDYSLRRILGGIVGTGIIMGIGMGDLWAELENMKMKVEKGMLL